MAVRLPSEDAPIADEFNHARELEPYLPPDFCWIDLPFAMEAEKPEGAAQGQIERVRNPSGPAELAIDPGHEARTVTPRGALAEEAQGALATMCGPRIGGLRPSGIDRAGAHGLKQ